MTYTDAGVYAHIPFCVSKCAYCNFVSAPPGPGEMERYSRALALEAELRRGEIPAANTVYLGGGTPSLMPIPALEAALRGIFDAFSPRAGAEITIEANPATFDLDKAKAWRALGVNRVSVGVQSDNDGALEALGRAHTWADALRAFAALERAGFDNISADFMYSLPSQTPREWRSTLGNALSLPVSHLSLYALSLEEGTPLYARARHLELPNEEESRAMTDIACEELAAHGLRRYEISNYALPGRESRHNLIYWRGGDYVGLGAAAHGLARGSRYENTASLADYLASAEGGHSPETARASRTADDVREETVMLWLRLTDGLPFSVFTEKTGGDFLRDYSRQANRLRSLGLLDWDADAVRVTHEGMHVHNAVLGALLT